MSTKPPAGSSPGLPPELQRDVLPPGSAETGLPPELERFGAELQHAVTRNAARSRGRRRIVTGAALAGLAALAVFAGIALFGGSGGGGPATVATASALDKAAAALHAPPGAILHVHMIATQDNGDGTTVSWQDESWQSPSPPYQRRQIEQASDTPRTDSGVVDGKDALYDAKTNTIYVSGQSTTGNGSAAPAPSGSPTADPAGGDAAGGDTVSPDAVVTISGSSVKDILIKVKALAADGRLTVAQIKTIEVALAGLKAKTAATASRFTVVVNGKSGRVELKWQTAGGGSGNSLTAIGNGSSADGVAGSSTASSTGRTPAADAGATDAGATDASSGGSDEAFRQEALAALKSPSTKVIGHVTVDGRDALKIVVSSHVTYLVDPQTYDPIEWITRGTSGGVVLRFPAYELLQPTADNLKLLSLTAQHPGARLDTNPADYNSATSRLFPKG